MAIYPSLFRRISRPTVAPSPRVFAAVALGTVVDNLDHGPERSPTPRTVLLRTLRYVVYGEVPWPVRRKFAPVTRPATSALLEAPEPALDGAHTLPSRTPLGGMLAWISSTLGRMICSVNEACSVMLPPFSPTACPRRSCTWPQAGASSSRSPGSPGPS